MTSTVTDHDGDQPITVQVQAEIGGPQRSVCRQRLTRLIVRTAAHHLRGGEDPTAVAARLAAFDRRWGE